jgi:hypothetical protein
MFKKKPLIEYYPAEDFFENVFVKSQSIIPEWYSKTPRWKNDKKIVDQKLGVQTFKQCIPFLDSLTSGYLITLPCDVLVASENNKPFISWKYSGENPILKLRNIEDNEKLPVPHGCSELQFVWSMPLTMKIQDGYSLLITHPFNRFELPFVTMSAIVDANFALSPYSNIPFFIQKDFNGIIKKGTPIAQVFPFRREDWETKESESLLNESKITGKKSMSVMVGWYKNNFWKQKKYN